MWRLVARQRQIAEMLVAMITSPILIPADKFGRSSSTTSSYHSLSHQMGTCVHVPLIDDDDPAGESFLTIRGESDKSDQESELRKAFNLA